LPNRNLTKNQKLKKFFKVVFSKHVLRTKESIFPLVKTELAKRYLIEGMSSAEPHGMGFLAKGTSPQTRSRIKNEKTEDQMGFFNLILTKNIMNTRN
jgi:hypothetical protein